MDNENILYTVLALVGGGVLGYFLASSGILGSASAQQPETETQQGALNIPCLKQNRAQGQQ